jgi:hypothetical protein
MWLMATVHAYDVMDRVQITASVSALETGEERAIRPVLTATALLDGAGVSNPRDWLEDVLVGLLETL